MARVLVTGGAGFIGSHLVEALAREGHSVSVLDALTTGAKANLASCWDQIEFREGSILDEACLARSAAGCQVIYHLAAISSVKESMDHPLRTHEVNATGSLMVLEAARREGASVVFSSSASVYGDSPLNPKREDQAAAPISLYGAQKVLAENCLAAYSGEFGIRGVSLRYFNVFGPRQDPGSPYSGVISIFIQKALSGEPLTLFGDGSQTRDFIAVEDVVRANLACLEKGRGVYNIGTGKETSIHQLAESILEAAGSQSELRFGPPRAADIARSCADVEKAAQELNFRAEADFEGALANTLRHLEREQTARGAR